MRTSASVALFGLLLSACSSTHQTSAQSGLDVHTFTHDSINTHLLVANGAMVMVDPGYEKNAPVLEQDLRDAGFDPAMAKTIVLTHGHADHAGAARHFQARFQARVVAGKGDEGMLGTGKNEPLCPTGFLGRFRHTEDEGATYTPFHADIAVTEPVDLASLSGVPGRIVPLPGHTKGSLVVLAGDAAFVGDLFRGSLVGSGAATHLYMCDLESNQRDVARLLNELAPDAKRYFVGHFGPVAREDVADHFGVSLRP
ncbi:MBL fold metallo-hydrolase [Polyangium sp. y55x31]|uniref:MBL fold metallo-hydrolase n=1 Tax=Polyangium sp. y55x31 TaxID=3042688 RepID=UPI002482FE5C|nr:MBL fold metallo-hydrolase [Polyangium sp. y55x31]MDI1480158.1 MBL fold metallo-hydrolase [Polyangium sp. y55x31]